MALPAFSKHFLELTGDEGCAELRLSIFEPDVHSYRPSFKLRTVAKDAAHTALEQQDYAFYVEMDLAVFKTAIKTAQPRLEFPHRRPQSAERAPRRAARALEPLPGTQAVSQGCLGRGRRAATLHSNIQGLPPELSRSLSLRGV